jgi:hypothetical protein
MAGNILDHGRCLFKSLLQKHLAYKALWSKKPDEYAFRLLISSRSQAFAICSIAPGTFKNIGGPTEGMTLRAKAHFAEVQCSS